MEIKLKPQDFESKWQEYWEQMGVYQPDLLNAKKPFYNLMMFPYPSAEGLHVGNMYAFTGADIYGRYKRMQGYDVFEPIGLDGFGIHSENYAIKIGKNPSEQAKISENNFYRQLHVIGNGFAWENHLETYDPEYYRWTQWIFVRMFKAGLAYRKKSPVNFCPSCKTVLSDEQVIDARPPASSLAGEVGRGSCERCKSTVEKRDMEQWYFRITNYAEKLLENLNKLEWTNKVKLGQKNWIGKKTGISIKYKVSGIRYQIECFTTRPDTNFGATFVVIAPEHKFVSKILQLTKQDKIFEDRLLSEEKGSYGRKKSYPERVAEQENFRLRVNTIKEYLEKTKSISEQDRISAGRKKTGVFTGFYAINQLNGYKMPIYISDFVLGHVGTGAVVGVPGHDLRDFEFAKEFDIPIIRVVVGKDGDKSPINKPEQVQEEEGTMVNSEFLNGMDIHQATVKMMDHLEEKGWGKRVTTYKLRDWCISRQRYWGAPIPMIFCSTCAEKGVGWLSLHDRKSSKYQVASSKEEERKKHATYYLLHTTDFMPGWFPVPEDQLPVLLPKDVKDWKPEGTGKGPLAKLKSFVNVACPECGEAARRETDVCDTFLDSSWYHLRYPSVVQKRHSGEEQDDDSRIRWGFWTRRVPDGNPSSQDDINLPWNPQITRKWLPVTQYIGGAEHTVLHLLYARFIWMCFYDWGLFDFSAKSKHLGGPATMPRALGWDEPYTRFYAHGLIIAEGAKMSKSKGNVVIPDEYIDKYGADTLRTYLMFLGPFDMGGDFKDTGIAGMYRFLSRVWRLVSEFIENSSKYKVASSKQNKEEIIPTTNYMLHSTNRIMHRTIKEVTDDLENLRYNTAIAHIMEFVNEIHKLEIRNLKLEIIETLLLLLAPFAPHMTEELWQKLSSKYQVASSRQNKEEKLHTTNYMLHSTDFVSIHKITWPKFDPKYLEEDEVTVIVQINGKVRDTIRMQNSESRIQNKVEDVAKSSDKVKKHLDGKSIRKVIFVPGKLINFVI